MKKYSMEKKALLLLIIFIISRTLILFYSPYVFHEEETKIASLGHDLVFQKKLSLPIFGYLDSPHAGGSLLAQIETIPFYLIFGDRYLAIKATAIFNSLLLFLMGLFLIEKYFGKTTMYIYAILMILGTPHFIQKNIMIHGNSIMLSLFLLITIFILSTIFIDKKLNTFLFGLLGFVMGVGLWLQYGVISIILLTFILGIFHLKEIKLRKTFVLALFFVLGFLPWLIYNFRYSFPSLFGDLLLWNHQLNLSQFFYRLVKLIVLDIPRSFHFIDKLFFTSEALAYLFYLIILISIFLSTFFYLSKIKIQNMLKRQFKLDKKSYFFIMNLSILVIIIILFTFFNSPVGSVLNEKFNSMNPHYEMYLLFLHPFLLILSSIGISTMIKHKNSLIKVLGILNVGIIVLISFIGFSSILSFSDSNIYLFSSPYTSGANSFEAGFNYIIHPPTFQKFFGQIKDKHNKNSFLSGSGVGLAHFMLTKKYSDKKIKEIAHSLDMLNDSEKKIVLLNFVQGDFSIETLPDNYKAVKPSQELVNILFNFLNDKDRIILKEVAKIE